MLQSFCENDHLYAHAKKLNITQKDSSVLP